MNSELLNELLSIALKALLAALVPVLALLARVAVQRLEAYLASKLDGEQLVLAGKLVSTVVLAVEQTAAQESAQEKKRQALQAAEAALKARGIALDLASLNLLVEAAVMREFNLQRRPE